MHICCIMYELTPTTWYFFYSCENDEKCKNRFLSMKERDKIKPVVVNFKLELKDILVKQGEGGHLMIRPLFT